MYKGRKVITIIGAAGMGKRMAAPLPKQFLKINGKTILETTVDKFNDLDMVDEIIVVTAKKYEEFCCRFFHEKKYDKVTVVTGGKERQDSIGNAIRYLEDKGTDSQSVILIHDGVRPYVSTSIINAVVKSASENNAAIAAVPVKDTVRHITEGTLDRSMLYNVQTPQGFAFDIISEAFNRARREGFYGTDEASLVERLGKVITIVPGEEKNIKITTPEDLKMECRIGTGYDVHRLVENRRLILGGVEIPSAKGLLGHSDADVLIHALMDAILGAAALGDIGKLFPDSDKEFENISSLKLLERVKNHIEENGYTVGNADITVICQKPKLADYIKEMRENIASILDISVDRVSIKATTTEKLGFAGRGEGIAAEAICLLNR